MADEATRKTHLRIDFVVREVADEEGIPEDDLRYVRFGDDVPIPFVRDFFDRCGNAMATLFKQGAAVLCLVAPGPNKIAAIKVIRELGGYGLKEAKDIIEGPMGTAIVICNDHYSSDAAVKSLRDTGCQVEVRTLRHADTEPRLPLAPLATYSRPA